MNNSEYWQQRFELLEEAQNNQRTEYLDLLKEEYEKSLSRIEKDITNWYTRIADNNEISFDNAKKLLDKKELKEFKWTVEEYIEKGRENAINQKWLKELENASARVHIDKLESIKIQIQNELELLHSKQDKDIESLVKQQYQEGYYKSAYEIQKGLGNFKSIQTLDKNKIEKIISKPWTTDNQTFSDRIWKHKEELVNTLQKDLTQATIRGDDLNKITKKIEKDFEVSRGKAGRLVMTESAFFSSAGQKECFNSLNVKQYEIVATLDSHTSEMCQNLDGKVFDMKDYEVGITAPPFHCWCRSTTAPYFDDEFTEGEQRTYRDEDGKTKYVDSKMKYKEWKEKYVNKEKNTSTNSNSDDIIKELPKKIIKSAKTVNLNNKVTIDNLLDKLKIDINDYKPFGKYDPFDNDIQEQTAKLLNFNKLPTILNDIEFNNAKGEEIIRVVHSYHGKTAEEAYQNTIKGKIQYSEDVYSSYGRGIYFGDKKIQDRIVLDYAKKDNKIINAKINSNAKILEFKNQLEYSKDIQSRLEKVPKELREFYKKESSLLYMLDEYDGIKLKWNNYYCIYNRGVLIINEQ